MHPSAKAAGGRRQRRWTRETITEKIADWAARYGAPPCSADWNPSLARWRDQEWRIERYQGGGWPSTNAVKRHFGGSFDAAVIAAGFLPARPGPKPRTPLPEVAEARSAEVELAALQRRLVRAEARAAAADARAADARRRARLASEREGRARRARERVVLAVEEVEERTEVVAADADARVRAAEDQAGAALRDAYDARRRAVAAEDRAATAEARARAAEASSANGAPSDALRGAEERAAALEVELRELGTIVSGERRRLSAAEVERLRREGPAGATVLAAALRALTTARASGDRVALAAALSDVAAAALSWRDRL